MRTGNGERKNGWSVRPILFAGLVMFCLLAILVILAARMRLATAAVLYHARFGDEINLDGLVVLVPKSYYPAFKDKTSVIIFSGDSRERARIYVTTSAPTTTDYTAYRDRMLLQEQAISLVTEKNISTELGTMRCFELKTRKPKPVVWCAMQDHRVAGRFEGVPERIGDLYYVLQHIRLRPGQP